MGTNTSKEKETPRARSNGATTKPKVTVTKPKVTTLPESATVLKPSPWVKNNPSKTSPQHRSTTNNETEIVEDKNDNTESDRAREEYIRQQNNNNTKMIASDNNTEDFGDDIMKSIPVSGNDSSWRGMSDSGDRGNVQGTRVFPSGMNRQEQKTQEHETYAQKHARAPYRHDEMRMFREKTIYRNPDEWEDSEEEEEKDKKFDVSKFKEANKGNVSSVSGLGSNTATTQKQDDFDMFFPESKQKTELALPDYDPSEEDLIASIEKEFT